MAKQSLSERLALRLYEAVLRLYPSEFRDEYGSEMRFVLRERYRDQPSAIHAVSTAAHAAWGVIRNAPKEHLHMISHDLRYAWRTMRKEPLVSAAAIAVLGLGIGCSTLVSSVGSALLVRPLPYPKAEQLVAVQEYHPTDERLGVSVAFPNYVDFRTRTQTLEDIAVYTEGTAILRGDGDAEQVAAAAVSDGLLSVLGVEPVLGRWFTKNEDRPKAPKVVVLSYELWQRRYGGDRQLLGRTIELGVERYRVLGILPPGFHFPQRAELWTPLQMDPAKAARNDYFLSAIARLKSGFTAAQANSEMARLLQGIQQEDKSAHHGKVGRAIPWRDAVAGHYRAALLTLLGASMLLLLIACANVGNLLLVKASARSREMAVRTALGAPRSRLVRQMIAESLLLGGMGGALGLVLAYASTPALLALVPVELPLWMDFSIDTRAVVFAVGVSVVTSLVFGIVPALVISRDAAHGLSEGGRGRTASHRQKLLRNSLVISEVALSLTLLVGAGLMMRSFLQLRWQQLGFQPENVVTMQISAPRNRYPEGPQARELRTRLRTEIESLPGAVSAAFASGMPLASIWGRSLTVEGYPVLPLKEAPSIYHVVTTPGYFRTLRLPILEGRDFTEADFGLPVTIVDESLAQRYWPGQRAAGKRVRFGPPEANEPWFTIIGVVAAAKNEAIRGVARMSVYIPLSNSNSPDSLLVRSVGNPRQFAESVRSRINAIDRHIVVSRVLTMPQIIDRVTWQDRFFAVLAGIFAILATAIAAFGLYAVLAYMVSLRRQEIGIRIALGAQALQVRAMVMRHGLGLAVAGLALGLAAALVFSRMLRSQLYGISAFDPVTYAAVLLVMLLVAAAASFLPSRRAAEIDPIVALRQD
ncbi:MAG TPA: ABC transporter permease [Bryobacteraceae bacterium]|nr:ABC transporter permease [Bryobacteraceae bacterium]